MSSRFFPALFLLAASSLAAQSGPPPAPPADASAASPAAAGDTVTLECVSGAPDTLPPPGSGLAIPPALTAIHARVPRALWRDRLLRLKRAGFNCVEMYTFWNTHEPQEGQFDFSGDLDLDAYLKLVHQVGMYAICRVGPYYCAEWDNGGLPAWRSAGHCSPNRACC